MISAMRDDRGSMVVQFAMVLLPLLALMIAVLEATVRFTAQEALNTQTALAARKLSSEGLMTASNASAQTFIRDTVCGGDGIPFLTSAACKSGLKVGILPVTSTTSIPAAVVNGALNSAAFKVTISKTRILLIRTGLDLPEVSWLLDTAGSAAAGHTLIVSGAIAKLDPYAEYNANGESDQPSF
ncbi:hypothetical protein V5F50_19795 [Xanthobacter sp. V13C-7B]|uniref:TadE/TadG family type IV pilus assembly protein n=1 Tax=Xanthobacter variabilis TaxID=3119932 RepID=UPI00372CC0E4